jgi:hypothetical protein
MWNPSSQPIDPIPAPSAPEGAPAEEVLFVKFTSTHQILVQRTSVGIKLVFIELPKMPPTDA